MARISETLGIALQHHQAGRLQEAEALYSQILQAQPNHPDALHLLGVVAHHGGRHQIAVDRIGRAIALNPGVAEFHNNIGEAYRALGKSQEAIASYQRALALKPGFAEAQYNLGLLHGQLGRLAEAEACYRRALAANPAYAAAHNNLGNVVKEQGKTEEAAAHYRRAVALKPDFAEAHNNLGALLQEQGRVKEAVGCFRQALSFKPDYAEAENQLMHQCQQLCEWNRFDELVERQRRRIRHSPSSLIAPFTMLCLPSSPSEQLACARNWVANRLSRVAALREGIGFRFTRTPKSRLRLGYLSTDYCEHPVAHLIAELFELHDRTAFEVFAYSYGPDDGGATRARITRACDRFVDIRAASFEQAAGLIHKDGVDILIDLTGYTKGARTEIVALRPAPIQVNYLGYTGTMGAEFIDYMLTDAFITPPGQEVDYAEALVYLPGCWLVHDRKRHVAERTPTRKECGLPGQGFVFCCFNSTHKIIPMVFDVWMRVLQEVPGSVLWLLESNSGVSENLRREAKARGVNPARLVFAPRVPAAQHLARLRVAGLFLDTLPFNAHLTASEALWVGLPVLTCPGETFASRVAGSLLQAVELPELIAASLSDYEAKAVRLARSPAALKAVRERLTKNRLAAPLFDSERYARHLEQAYRVMWDRYMRGEAPRPIEVPNLAHDHDS
ncbi:MAG: tetratricopeptide repeat protein [Nitrospirae bacterium]|nr:MAG: tetratricopeptide repeat protein [Nitrospirota bacterium]